MELGVEIISPHDPKKIDGEFKKLGNFPSGGFTRCGVSVRKWSNETYCSSRSLSVHILMYIKFRIAMGRTSSGFSRWRSIPSGVVTILENGIATNLLFAV